MALSLNGQSFSPYELQVACAIRRYVCNSPAHVVDDEVIGFIISYRRHGFGQAPVDCRNLVWTVQHSHTDQCRTYFADVVNNRAYWEHEARQLYDNWLGASCKGAQRFSAQRPIGEYL
ncbi:hypothetical protein JMJ35_008957 [Cladonia borealis]|uniref:Uncharacterized protein n=1 Tax=Cladonia borealis TaxID=184061 RepID=A0AA39QUJ5_9LECA|nr:hypothetical protein JMJ35_008957 [Cladonia borealis]